LSLDNFWSLVFRCKKWSGNKQFHEDGTAAANARILVTKI